MSITQLLLSFEGRIPRSVYWLKFIIPVMVIYVILIFIDAAMGTINSQSGVGVLSGLLTLLVIYPSLAVGVKRCHDRNRSGWFILVCLIPILNLWPLVEMYFLKGTTGDNDYGPDPLS